MKYVLVVDTLVPLLLFDARETLEPPTQRKIESKSIESRRNKSRQTDNQV